MLLPGLILKRARIQPTKGNKLQPNKESFLLWGGQHLDVRAGHRLIHLAYHGMARHGKARHGMAWQLLLMLMLMLLLLLLYKWYVVYSVGISNMRTAVRRHTIGRTPQFRPWLRPRAKTWLRRPSQKRLGAPLRDTKLDRT